MYNLEIRAEQVELAQVSLTIFCKQIAKEPQDDRDLIKMIMHVHAIIANALSCETPLYEEAAQLREQGKPISPLLTSYLTEHFFLHYQLRKMIEIAQEVYTIEKNAIMYGLMLATYNLWLGKMNVLKKVFDCSSIEFGNVDYLPIKNTTSFYLVSQILSMQDPHDVLSEFCISLCVLEMPPYPLCKYFLDYNQDDS